MILKPLGQRTLFEWCFGMTNFVIFPSFALLRVREFQRLHQSFPQSLFLLRWQSGNLIAGWYLMWRLSHNIPSRNYIKFIWWHKSTLKNSIWGIEIIIKNVITITSDTSNATSTWSLNVHVCYVQQVKVWKHNRFPLLFNKKYSLWLE